MSWDALSQQLLAKHSVKVDAQALQKLCCTTANAPTDASLFSVRDAFQRVLNANLQELVSAPGLLPRNTGSLPQATLEAAVVVQIQTARDATQPLRPCADMDDAEALLSGAANQKQTSHRLLRLTVTDGVVEVPAIELQTLCAFRSIPTPGEKLLLKVGTEVRGGMVIMTDKDVEWLGGCEQHLRDEHALRKHRALIGGIGSGGGGLEGAPKFAPLEAVGAVRAATAAPGLHHHKQPMHGIGKPEQHHPQGRSNAHGDPQGRGGSASTRGGGDGQHRGGSRGGRGTASRGRGDDRHAGRGHGAGSRGGRGGHGDQHRHQHHHDPRGGSAGYVGGRGHGAGGYRGGTATAAFPPPQPSRPAMPQFTDADFPSLGGDW